MKGDNPPPGFHVQPCHLGIISYVHVTRLVKQSYMKETFGDNCIKVLISDCDKHHTKWRGTRFARKLALEKLYYSCVFLYNTVSM